MSFSRQTVAILAALGVLQGVCSAAVTVLDQSSNVDVEVIDEGVGRLNSGSLAVDQSPTGETAIGPRISFRSYLIKIHNFDSPTLESYDAAFAVDEPVLGVQTDVNSLRPGRQTLDDNGFDAGAPQGGIEDNDTVTLDGDLMVSGKVGNRGVDPIRVFVAAAAVPEVASAAVWGTFFLAGLVGCGRIRPTKS